jgi:serine/threonine-protein kinase
MVCGQVPYTGTTFEVMTKQVREPLPSPKDHVPDLPDELCDVIRKMMAKAPADRYQTYDELQADFAALLADGPVSASGFRDQSMVNADLPLGGNGMADISAEKTQLANPPSRRGTPWMIYLLIGLMAVIAVGILVLLVRD